MAVDFGYDESGDVGGDVLVVSMRIGLTEKVSAEATVEEGTEIKFNYALAGSPGAPYAGFACPQQAGVGGF